MPTTMDDLPEELLRQILSFLPTIDVMKFSFLSPKWRNLWRSFPNLNFEIFPLESRFRNLNPREIRHQFAEFISNTLLRRTRSSALSTFRLFYDYAEDERYKNHVGSWLLYAVNSDVSELDFDFGVHILTLHRSSEIQVKQKYDIGNNEGDGLSFYSFPLTDLKNSSVEILKIRSCFVTSPAKTRVSSLKSLYLSDTCLKGGEIEGIISICSNLEFLSIEDAWFLEDFKIESSKLKELRFCKFRGPHLAMKHRAVKILAPCLDSIRFISFYLGKYDLEDVPSLVKAHVEFESREKLQFACWSHLLRSLGGVEHLTVQNLWIWSLIEPSKLHSEFENDEEVDMQLVSKSDKEPVPDGEKKRYGKLLPAEDVFSESFTFNNLKELELLTGYTKDDLLGLEALLERCPRLESMVLKYSYQSDHDENLAEEVTGRIILHMRNLRVVKMKNYRGTKNELCVKDLLIRHKVALERIVALPPAEVGGSDYPVVLWPRTFRY